MLQEIGQGLFQEAGSGIQVEWLQVEPSWRISSVWKMAPEVVPCSCKNGSLLTTEKHFPTEYALSCEYKHIISPDAMDVLMGARNTGIYSLKLR